MPPGGRVDAAESPLEGAVRELNEETGVAVAVSSGERAALVDVVQHPLADGTPAFTFGVGYAFRRQQDRTTGFGEGPAGGMVAAGVTAGAGR